MKIKGIFLILVAIIFQATLSSYNNNNVFPFLDGIPISTSDQYDYQAILLWFIPIVSLSFCFSGNIREKYISYEQLKLVREHSKAKWVISQFLNITVILLIFTLSQITIFYIYSLVSLHNLDVISVFNNGFVMMALMYYLTLLNLFSFQLFLELYYTSQIAQLNISVYIIFSLILTKKLVQLNSPKIIHYFLIPNYSNGLRTGLSDFSHSGTSVIKPSLGLFILIILQVTIVILSVLKFKNIDMLKSEGLQ
ncbi:DUF2705 family protein [Bacillus inaquosorum]